jgi:dihydroorotate dehydrogenase subfamily 2
MKTYIYYLLIFLAFLGMLDAGFLTYEHFQNKIPPCTVGIIAGDCGKVLTSTYSVSFGIPLALIGLLHYYLSTIAHIYAGIGKKRKARYLTILLAWAGLISSLYFVYLQLVIIQAICLFCMGSAAISIALFFLVQAVFKKEQKLLFFLVFGFLYRNVAKKILFQIDPEIAHERIARVCQLFGKTTPTRAFAKLLFHYKNKALTQKIAGITFENPVGLAAGFDYEAQFTQTLPAIGFGFETVGTITNHAYEGNKRPMLGRLPKSKSLMVNKGFKNLGAAQTAKHLTPMRFSFPLGISIGTTNVQKKMTIKEAINDILAAFRVFEKSKTKHAYYELNISCPNLYADISFYPPKNLKALLTAIDTLHLKKPVFVKMPINQTDKEVLAMLNVIAGHSPVGVIFGNLQTDRKNKALNQSEVKRFSVGYFSGKPTYARSNELIKLAYKHYKKRFVIIGCGGIFSAEDAYEKITSGATLVQLITGMIFVGPQLISDSNIRLLDLLHKDGFNHISQAIGSRNK